MRQRGPQIGAPFKDSIQSTVGGCAIYLQPYHVPVAHFVHSSHGLFTRHVGLLLASTYTLVLISPFSHGDPSWTIASLCLRCQPLRNKGTIAKHRFTFPLYILENQWSNIFTFGSLTVCTFIRFHTLVSNAYNDDIDPAKNLFGCPSLIYSQRRLCSLLRHFTPPAVANYAQSSLYSLRE